LRLGHLDESLRLGVAFHGPGTLTGQQAPRRLLRCNCWYEAFTSRSATHSASIARSIWAARWIGCWDANPPSRSRCTWSTPPARTREGWTRRQGSPCTFPDIPRSMSPSSPTRFTAPSPPPAIAWSARPRSTSTADTTTPVLHSQISPPSESDPIAGAASFPCCVAYPRPIKGCPDWPQKEGDVPHQAALVRAASARALARGPLPHRVVP